MIRLEIYPEGARSPLVPNLPADLSFELIRENPFFKRRGDYTYDIDISLKDPHNRPIYGHIDRLTIGAHPKGRKAKLICGGRTVCEGTEVILKKEEDIVKIQILAGESEINFLTADENLRIRNMNFGTIPTPTQEMAQQVVHSVYPQANYVFPVIYKNDASGFDNEVGAVIGDTPSYSNTELWPQPFLLYYVEKFVQLLGYNLGNNELRSYPKWCRLVLISGYRTLEYAKMLPNWSAAEFLSQIEKFFNCVFLVNPLTKVVDIRFLPGWYSGNQPVRIEADNIVDSFIRDYDEEDGIFQNNYKNISYALPSGEYWKFASLDNEVQKHCQQLTMRPNEAAQLGDVNWKIFNDPDYGFQFVRIREQTEGGQASYSRMINQFAPYVSDESADSTEFKIIPAEIHLHYVMFTQEDPTFPNYGYYLCAHPQFYDQQDLSNFKDVIVNGINDNSGDVMQVAFYAGMIGVRVPLGDGTYSWVGLKYPMCFAQRYYLEGGLMQITENEVPGASTMTLELSGQNGRAVRDYGTALYADISQKHTIQFRSEEMLNPNDLYVIAGRLFICQQIKYTYANGKQHPVAEGVFYPYSK